jgi:diguanylate cyclase (GGDEF)-like protein
MIQLHRQVAAKNVLLQELAVTDTLTGLPNRRGIEEWAGRQMSCATRHEFPFHVAIADLDHFKLVNDTYGHEVGDKVLVKFAEILRANCRTSDLCGRMGGEEFLLAFTHATDENAGLFAERIRGQLEATEFRFKEHAVKVNANFGVAGRDGMKTSDINSLISRADVALYSAKRRGRNRVEIAPAIATTS